MDEALTKLLLDANALGVWVFGPMVVSDNQYKNDVLGRAVRDPSTRPPVKLMIQSETYLDFGDWQVFAWPVGTATLVVVFDEQSSLGLIRLRARNARPAIERALAPS